ncbi:unnamed protein product [Penicillium salamii]|nr:unnamed protein product [Penicillium salamii]CAG8880490.1 unnamed protein product [Penicillium salamii]
MSLNNLPIELLLVVGHYLELLHDINCLSRTCCLMNRIFAPLLYKRDSQTGRVALLWAAQKGFLKTSRLATYRQEADLINVTDRSGRTSLSHAVEKGHEAVVELLLETGRVEVDWKDSHGLTPLAYA